MFSFVTQIIHLLLIFRKMDFVYIYIYYCWTVDFYGFAQYTHDIGITTQKNDGWKSF